MPLPPERWDSKRTPPCPFLAASVLPVSSACLRCPLRFPLLPDAHLLFLTFSTLPMGWSHKSVSPITWLCLHLCLQLCSDWTLFPSLSSQPATWNSSSQAELIPHRPPQPSPSCTSHILSQHTVPFSLRSFLVVPHLFIYLLKSHYLPIIHIT